jgi:hypothetical protein
MRTFSKIALLVATCPALALASGAVAPQVPALAPAVRAAQTPAPEPDEPVPAEPAPPLRYELAPVFSAGGPYAHLGEVPEEARTGAVYGGPFGDWGGQCWAKASVCTLPESIWNRTVIFNDDAAPWGEHGPMRASREVNVTGVAKGITYWRPGDWTMGRDGHGFYWNVLGDVTLEGCAVVEGGGQAFQLVSRPGETGIPWADDPDDPTPEADTVTERNALGTLTLRDCRAIDCGQIERGMMVHSSYPVSIFNPGQRVEIDGLVIRCEFPELRDKYDKPFRSRGGLFLGPGQIPTARTPVAWIRGLDVEVTKADRQELVLWGVDEVHVIEPRIVDHGGAADVAIVVQGESAVGRVEIVATQTPLRVHLHANHPHRPPIETVEVPAGGDFTWPR